MYSRRAPAISLACILSGCTGVRFANQTVDDGLPNDYTNRTRIANSADYRFNLPDNIGAILEEDPTKPGLYRLAATSVIRPEGFNPKEIFLAKEDNQVYNGKVTAGGQTSGNYTAVGLSLEANQVAEISIVDVSRADIPTPEIPVAALHNYAQTKPAQKQYWIKSLLLSRLLKRIYVEQKADFAASGPAFGANGKVYGTTAIQSNDFNLTAVLIDIDTYKTTKPHITDKSFGDDLSTNVPGVVTLRSLCAQPLKSNSTPGSISNCPR